jgi:hypothetical protein
MGEFMETIDSDSRLGAAIKAMAQNRDPDAPSTVRIQVKSDNVIATYEIRLVSVCFNPQRSTPTKH